MGYVRYRWDILETADVSDKYFRRSRSLKVKNLHRMRLDTAHCGTACTFQSRVWRTCSHHFTPPLLDQNCGHANSSFSLQYRCTLSCEWCSQQPVTCQADSLVSCWRSFLRHWSVLTNCLCNGDSPLLRYETRFWNIIYLDKLWASKC
jgi:hypothetical protein